MSPMWHGEPETIPEPLSPGTLVEINVLPSPDCFYDPFEVKLCFVLGSDPGYYENIRLYSLWMLDREHWRAADLPWASIPHHELRVAHPLLQLAYADRWVEIAPEIQEFLSGHR